MLGAMTIDKKKGIDAPSWFKDTMLNTIGHRQTELALQLGKVYTPREALDVGLVDEVVADPNELMKRANECMRTWCKVPGKMK